MLFTIVERNALPSLMPRLESFALRKIIREFCEACSLSVEEIKNWEVKFGGDNFFDEKGMLKGVVPEGQMQWNGKKAGTKDIEVPEVIRNIIIAKLKELDESRSMPIDFPDSLYERFVIQGEK